MAAVFHCVGDGRGEAGQSNELILPPGFGFSPKDHELIEWFLVNKIMGIPIPYNIIKDIDVYECDPRQLPTSDLKHGKTKNEAYYFTKAGKTWRRTTKGGYWKATYEQDINGRGGKIIGMKTIQWVVCVIRNKDDDIEKERKWSFYEEKAEEEEDDGDEDDDSD
ncbi:No apical meristem (NAM) protein [Corchorus capsularis]|uniref:No apical meristem (NAM) protein n=1 Tax=Corchorus capsularis TaxID=210143 RepID=A0A1R3JUG4_COCAP|nr:No apical meristem (NAM) protein [Corchorus capsularis]